MNENAEVGSRTCSRYIYTPAEQREEWARRFSESGLSLRKFSAEHGLHWYSLWRWVDRRRQLPKQGSVAESGPETLEFAEVKLPVGEEVKWVAELSLPDGRVIRLSKDVPASMLEQLLRVC